MANRVKEDEKNERTIRSLLKLPENRRCINCNSLGPQYVCTNFWTFVCTTCSGIHREFTHRVKSVSMAKFTSQEVAALQGGGNARAKEGLLKEWDSQRNSFPDSSNIERLRDFIKHVYVDRRYTGEKAFEKPSKVKMGEESYENRRTESYQGGSRSPPYEDTYERRYSDRPSPGGRSDDSNSRYDERRSPGYDRENRQYGDYGRSPIRPEIVNDWRRDDRFGNGNRKTSDGDSRSGDRSPDYQKDKDMTSPPIVRPVRDILGENVTPLRIIEPPKANGTRVADGFVNTLRTSSSSSLGSADGNPVEPKRETLGSLIDFDADPEPPAKAAAQQPQQTFMTQSTAQPTSTSSDANWASFEVVTEAKVSHFPSNVNNLESLLSQLSVPASVPGQLSRTTNAGDIMIAAPVGNMSHLPTSGHSFIGPVSHTSMSTFTGGVPSSLPVSGPAPIPPSGAPPVVPVLTSISPVNGVNSFDKVNDAGQWPIMQHQHSLFPAAGFQSSGQQFTSPVVAPTTQPWNPSFAPNTQGTSSETPAQAHQVVSKLALEGNSSFLTQPSPAEAKSTGRTALPEDIFAATYPSIYAPVPGWQSGPPGAMGYAMQYNTAAPIPAFSQPSKLTNPFDLNNELHPLQAPSFPFMTSLHGALPNMPPPTGLLRTASLGTPVPAWMPPQSSSYASALPHQAPPFSSALPPRAYMGQQIPNNMPPSWHQGDFGNERAAFGSSNSNQLLSGGYSAPATPTSFPSAGGNPFG